MAPQPSSVLEAASAEREILTRLLGLYAEEVQVYRRVLELSLQQGAVLREGGDLSAIRRLLEQKKRCLEVVSRLETDHRAAKAAWEKGRNRWSAGGKVRLHAALHEVAELIEEILICEEKNDMDLIEQAGVGR